MSDWYASIRTNKEFGCFAKKTKQNPSQGDDAGTAAVTNARLGGAR